jgi:hypothetical protein
LKTKLKGSHFDATEVTEAESQAVLNTLTEHAFQDAFKKWFSCSTHALFRTKIMHVLHT